VAKILVVEDDIDIAQGVAEFLEAKGFTLDFAYTGKQALSLLDSETYHLVLLDINLPFVSGIDISKSLLGPGARLAKLPVIIMSAKGAEQDIVEGFQSGAWDYLTKPFSFSELLARVEVNLAKGNVKPLEGKVAQYKNVRLNFDALTISVDDQSVQLHQVGFDILKVLINHAPNVVKTAQIHHQLWDGSTPESDPLRAHIYKLRKLLNSVFGQSLITTVKGVGYRFELQNSEGNNEEA